MLESEMDGMIRSSGSIITRGHILAKCDNKGTQEATIEFGLKTQTHIFEKGN